MRFFKRLFYVSAAGLFALTSCAEFDSESFDKYEDIALKAWMKVNRSELLDNYQQQGGYYVDIIEPGDADAAPVNDTICWVTYDFTGRDLAGNIILSRSELDAKQTNSFTKYTHYVPLYRYCGEYSNMSVEGTHLALRNKLTLGQEYFERHKDRLGIDKPEILLREGSKVELYLPSRVVRGLQGDGGYEGEYSLSDRKPLIVQMTVVDTVKNPLTKEGLAANDFCTQDGGLEVFDTKDNKRPTDLDAANHPYNDTAAKWANVCDSIPEIYVNFRFRPDERLNFPEQYKSGYEPYNNFTELERKISEALVKRFHPDEDKPYVGVKALADTVTVDGTAKIWYIGRFLDGFIFDTNIDEVRKIIYGDEGKKGSVYSYKPKDGGSITAWYYAVANLRYGQWAALVTTSSNAYGSSGKSGGSQSGGGYGGYMDYLNYYNYYNMYYGGMGGYGGYYPDYYGMGGMGGYPGGYPGSYPSTGEEQKPTVSTEIPPFTPLIFEMYIEPKEED